MNKLILTSFFVIFSNVGGAQEIKEKMIVTFYTGENISSVAYQVFYPNLTNDTIVAGKEKLNQLENDCLAFVYSSGEVSGYNMRELANALIVRDEGKDLYPTNKNGTLLFYMTPNPRYVTSLEVTTRDGRSFSENKKSVIGDENGVNLRLEYRRGCRGVK